MAFTDTGRKMITIRLGSATPEPIGFIGIGSGSGTASVSDSTLLNNVNRINLTGSPDFTTDQKVTFQGDLNSIQMSGIDLTEFGLSETASGTGFPGSMWLRESFGSIVFDGSNELQVIATVQTL